MIKYWLQDMVDFFDCCKMDGFFAMKVLRVQFYSVPSASVMIKNFVFTVRNYFLDEVNYKNIKRPPGDQSFVLGRPFTLPDCPNNFFADSFACNL